ncbi:MAG: HAD family phosphatase [Gammaproteobacteria bacterium]|nr:HAD family phosphatase [Gammaproteobacteria bacterium]
MELIVFDLDGTLLNRHSQISDYTRETLQLLTERHIAYTVATGRTLHASRDILKGHGFVLPHVYKNGVVIWHPEQEHFSHHNLLSRAEMQRVLDACASHDVTPFVFTLVSNNDYTVYHGPPRNGAEEYVVNEYAVRRGLVDKPLEELPDDAVISNISAVGDPGKIRGITDLVGDEPHLVAYRGVAIEDPGVSWLDIHHSDASKGGALLELKTLLGLERVICFGDSDNDLSMFELADEAYAPENAKEHVKAMATATIGHHDNDGIAKFLRERFALDD